MAFRWGRVVDEVLKGRAGGGGGQGREGMRRGGMRRRYLLTLTGKGQDPKPLTCTKA